MSKRSTPGSNCGWQNWAEASEAAELAGKELQSGDTKYVEVRSSGLKWCNRRAGTRTGRVEEGCGKEGRSAKKARHTTRKKIMNCA